MPPQQTNITPEAGRDASELRLELAIALGKEATGDDLAGARPMPISEALTIAFSENEAAQAASTRNVLSLLKRCWRAFQDWRRRTRLRASLHDLSERELNDIGLTPGDIEYMVAHRAIERLRDGMAHLWQSRGLM